MIMWEGGYCFIGTDESVYDVMVLASNTVSYLLVTMEASEHAYRESSGNWKMLNVSLKQLGSSV